VVTDVKLHAGSGPWPLKGWVNVDVTPLPECPPPDVWADLAALPFSADTFAQIYLGHVLEHIPLDRLPAVFIELRRVAAPNCRLAIVGPCYERAVAERVAPWLLDAIRAHGAGPGGHAWTPTTALTRQILLDAGLTIEEVPVDEVRKPEWCNANHAATWQCAFLARWPD
jgi:hypothetical protein